MNPDRSWSTDAAVESDDILGYDGSIYVPPAGSQHLREEQSEFHTLIPRVYVNHLDMADITVGPVIGKYAVFSFFSHCSARSSYTLTNILRLLPVIIIVAIITIIIIIIIIL